MTGPLKFPKGTAWVFPMKTIPPLPIMTAKRKTAIQVVDAAFKPKDRVRAVYIAGGAVINPVKRGQALPQKEAVWVSRPGNYVPGDGEVRQVQRPGSDMSHIKSKGLGT